MQIVYWSLYWIVYYRFVKENYKNKKVVFWFKMARNVIERDDDKTIFFNWLQTYPGGIKMASL